MNKHQSSRLISPQERLTNKAIIWLLFPSGADKVC